MTQDEGSLRERLLRWVANATQAKQPTWYVVKVPDPDLPYGMRFIVTPGQFGTLTVEVFQWQTRTTIARRTNVLACDVFDTVGQLLEEAGV